MDKKTVADKEDVFAGFLQTPPYPVDDMLALIADVPAAKAEEWTLVALQALVEAADFSGALKLAMARKDDLARKISGTGIRDALRKCTKDRLLLAAVDAVGFGTRPAADALARLKRLVSLQPGTRVLSEAWGLGEIRRVDGFYRRITVDFPTRKGHQFSFDAACETLAPAPEGHILVTAAADPARLARMLKDSPGEFVQEMLKSFGDMPLTR